MMDDTVASIGSSLSSSSASGWPRRRDPTAELAEDLGVDSVDASSSRWRWSASSNVSLPDKIFGDIRTVQDVIDIVREQSERLAEVDHN